MHETCPSVTFVQFLTVLISTDTKMHEKGVRVSQNQSVSSLIENPGLHPPSLKLGFLGGRGSMLLIAPSIKVSGMARHEQIVVAHIKQLRFR